MPDYLINQTMSEEIWKDIIGYEGLYQISSHGRARRVNSLVNHNYGGLRKVRERVLKYHKIRHDYLAVCLCKNNIKKTVVIHRLVAIHFIGQPKAGQQCNHIDFDITNNHVENLEWVTTTENNRHSYHRRCAALKRKAVIAKNSEGEIKLRFNSVFEAAKFTNKNVVNGSNIIRVIKKKTPYRNLYWEYENMDN